MSELQVSRYHPALVALHWLLALFIIAALALGALVLVRIPNNDPMKLEALHSHMTGGAIIVLLMLTRLVARARTRHPSRASTGRPSLDKLAWISHRLFYFLVVGMAASGGVMAVEADLPSIVFGGHGTLPADFWIFAPRYVHYAFSRLLMILIAVHITGALYHTFIVRDRLLSRMAFGARRLRKAERSGVPANDEVGLFWRFAPWLVRAMLALPIVLFILIGSKYLSDPSGVAAGSQMSLGSPAAITNMRVNGALFLALALVAVLSLLSTRRLLAGLIFVAIIVGFVTAARIFGAFVDGASSETVFKLVPEVVLLTITLAALAIESARRRQVGATAA